MSRYLTPGLMALKILIAISTVVPTYCSAHQKKNWKARYNIYHLIYIGRADPNRGGEMIKNGVIRYPCQLFRPLIVRHPDFEATTTWRQGQLHGRVTSTWQQARTSTEGDRRELGTITDLSSSSRCSSSSSRSSSW